MPPKNAYSEMMRIVSAKPGSHIFKNDAAAAEAMEELERIEKEKGRLDTEDIIEAARQPCNTLHQYYEWDPKKAHQKYLKLRTGEIKHAIRITYTTPDGDEAEVSSTIRVHIRQDEVEGGEENRSMTVTKVFASGSTEVLSRNAEQAFGMAYGHRGAMKMDPEGRFDDLIDVMDVLAVSMGMK